LLGDLVPRPQEHMPSRTIVDLGRLMAAVHQAALVLCIDQLEEMIDQAGNEQEAWELFRRGVDTPVAGADVIPTAVRVIACLEDFFQRAEQFLTRSKVDRLKHDPEPIRLASRRDEPEIEAMIARRLEFLFEAYGLKPDPNVPTYPFRPEHLGPLVGLRTR